MHVGVPKAIKVHEYRVGLNPVVCRRIDGARPCGDSRDRRRRRRRGWNRAVDRLFMT